MNDKLKFPFFNTDWMNSNQDWFQNQNQYMDAWSSFRKFMPPSSSDFNPIHEAMNSWWSNASPSLTDQNYDFYNKMMQQGKAFYFLGEQFNKLLEGLNEVKSKSADWEKVLNENFETMKNILDGASSGMPGVFTMTPHLQGEFNDENFKMAEMSAFMNKLLSVPGFGPDRETLTQIQDGIKLFNEYQQVSGEFNATMGKVGVEALEAMRCKFLEMGEQKKEINSLREIYDLWVDCNEKAYAELVYTDEYSELYGRLTNSQLALKQHYGKIFENILTKMNMPTRQGMNTVLKRVQEMKRSQSKSKAKINVLENEIRALRQLVEGENKPLSSASSRTIASKKKPTKKKVTKKKVTKKASNKTPKKIAKKVSKKTPKKVSKKVSKKPTKKSSPNKAIVINI